MSATHRHTGTSTVGVWYAAHLYETHDGSAFAVLLCVGRGPVLGYGLVNRAVPVGSFASGVALMMRYCGACARWRSTEGGA